MIAFGLGEERKLREKIMRARIKTLVQRDEIRSFVLEFILVIVGAQFVSLNRGSTDSGCRTFPVFTWVNKLGQSFSDGF